jgi:hypothetical protein
MRPSEAFASQNFRSISPTISFMTQRRAQGSFGLGKIRDYLCTYTGAYECLKETETWKPLNALIEQALPSVLTLFDREVTKKDQFPGISVRTCCVNLPRTFSRFFSG